MNTLEIQGRSIPVMDCSPHANKEAFIGLYGSPETPYKLIVNKGNAVINCGEFATAQEALESVPEGFPCHWFVVGKNLGICG